MHTFSYYIKNISNVLTSIISGFLLFLAVLALILINTVMTSDFHKNMFEKNEIYVETQKIIDDSREDVVSLIKGQSSELSQQQKEIIYILENSTSPEMVRTNLDKINQDIFQYFNGKRRFLPDIYVDMKPPNFDKIETTDSNYVSSKITRVNLNALIMSFNRGDILDVFLLIRFLFFCINSMPALFLLAVLFMLLIQIIIMKKPSNVLGWILNVCFFSSILFVILGVSIFIYSKNLLPVQLNEIMWPIPINLNALLSYIQDSTSLLSLLSILSGISLFLLAYIIILFKKTFLKFIANKNLFKLTFIKNYKNLFKHIICTFLFISILLGLGYNVYSFRKDFNSNNFSNIISKYTNSSSVTEVVSAKNENIYTLQINLVDSDTNAPVENVEINVDGKAEVSNKHYNLTETTDNTGIAKFHLRKGTFHIDFLSASPLDNYILPSPFYFDLISVGTTVITINLDKHSESESYGVIEIEILDHNNEPFEEIELLIENSKTHKKDILESNDTPDKYYSITNPDGIAVFKKEKGTYIAKFSESKFPKEYIIPEPFEINILPGIVSRYTIKLTKSE
ncbi:hypothetical protein RBH29_03470 [Herbivorax sp. ANBcel31]|uniref:hypothetical protein n=1 Tax=Herbivorax sp. ANBcel31 TaxID=3069754 RepID=UPI0027AEB77F|nr:hypothetical protein [Herbivorax sp. ANBcel31]MDQ2085491.1 hypothetical protein [Herbivorax sp. ANBcel31]